MSRRSRRPFHRFAVPLPRIGGGGFGTWYISFPRRNGGSGEL
ncbi:hypothetical protein HMPREF9081_2097, partial [Centipeda periodontii DSM 2778]